VLREKLGPRFVPEALFIIGVAIVAMLLELAIPAAIGLTLAAWLLVVVAEIAFARQRRQAEEPAEESAAAAEPPATVAELPEEPAPVEVAPAAVPVVEPEPEVEEEPEPEPDPESEPEQKPEPERAPAPPQLVAVPDPEPEPEPDPAPEPVPNVVELRPAEPREWNVWELERRARDRAGVDATRDEEWRYLLLYLREFASPEGTLPRDFDPLVRESFGELIEAP
jgi:outer membrane biosynthesis protein TonB